MNVIFEKMKPLVPRKKCRKFRKDSEFVIVMNPSNKIVYLNTTAGDIFLLCNGEKSIAQIFQEILSEYEVEPEILEHDFIKIIQDFRWNRIIELHKEAK